jgi:hypothetical protein
MWYKLVRVITSSAAEESMGVAGNVTATLAAFGLLFLASVSSLFNRHSGTALSVLLAGVALAVPAAWLARRRWALAVLGAVGGPALGVLLWHTSAPSFSELRADGDRMVAAVEQFRHVNGRWPETLAEAGVTPPDTRFGPWRYQVKGEEFYLSVGDYGEDLFVLYYSSRTGEWYSDT